MNTVKLNGGNKILTLLFNRNNRATEDRFRTVDCSFIFSVHRTLHQDFLRDIHDT